MSAACSISYIGCLYVSFASSPYNGVVLDKSVVMAIRAPNTNQLPQKHLQREARAWWAMVAAAAIRQNIAGLLLNFTGIKNISSIRQLPKKLLDLRHFPEFPFLM